jgi:hypothetical protein
MEYPEFSSLARRTMAAVRDRLPTPYRDAFEGTFIAGEFRYGVRYLAMFVCRERIPVTAGERDDFRRLLDYLGEPVSLADEMVVRRA